MVHATELAAMDRLSSRERGMRKSYSIDSSLSAVTHHQAPREHADRPHGVTRSMGLSGLKTLHEDRGRSPPGVPPRSASPRDLPALTPLSAAVPESPSPTGAPTHLGISLRAALVAAATLAVLLAALLLAPVRLSGVLDVARAARQGGGGSSAGGPDINHTIVAAGCANIDVVEGFDLDKFMGDWHHIAWLHSTAEASAWASNAGHQCTSVALSRPASSRGTRTAGGGLGGGSGGSGARGSGASGGAFRVQFTHRPLPQHAGRDSEDSLQNGRQQPSVIGGVGSTPQAEHPGKLQVRLDSGHVLPFWVVSTDYTSWAVMCSTSASLGGGTPAQVLTLLRRDRWSHDRLDIGDRLNELAARGLPWKEAVFAPSSACAAGA